VLQQLLQSVGTSLLCTVFHAVKVLVQADGQHKATL
jgi:hypothetical protein